MRKVNLELYHEDAIDFILEEAEKQLAQTVESYRQNNNKIYAAMSLYIASIVFSVNRILQLQDFDSSIILLGGAIIAMCIIWKVLFHAVIVLPGTPPQMLVKESFESLHKDKQLYFFKKRFIEELGDSIKDNEKENESRLNDLKQSVYMYVISASLFAVSVCASTFFHWF
jgi:hypothetical protein